MLKAWSPACEFAPEETGLWGGGAVASSVVCTLDRCVIDQLSWEEVGIRRGAETDPRGHALEGHSFFLALS